MKRKSISCFLHAPLFLALSCAFFQQGWSQQLPVTDNLAAPYLGVYKQSLGTQDGIRRDNFFAWWLNRSAIYATTFNGPHSAPWSEIAGNVGYISGWKRWCDAHPRNKVVLGVQMLAGTGNVPLQGVSLAKGARGDYDAHFKSLASKIRDAGICDQVIVRLGWEFNGNWYPWRVQPKSAENNAAHFAACFCRISKVMREVEASPDGDPGKNPAKLRFNWCGTKIWNSYKVTDAYPGNTPEGTTSTGVSYPAYPGDDYVHSVGVDLYDTDPSGTTYGSEKNNPPFSEAVAKAAWANIVGTPSSEKGGVAVWQKIANDHGKTMSFPEWGLSTKSKESKEPAGGQDNPWFIQNMFNYIHDPKNNVEFHAYFDATATGSAGSNHRICQAPGEGPTANPNAAAKFRQLFSPPLPDRANIGSITAATSADGLNIAGGGTGYAGTMDEFYFTSRPASPNDMMQAKFTSASAGAGQAGIMIRQGSTAGDAHAVLFVANGNLAFQCRPKAGSPAVSTPVAKDMVFPIWIRLVRQGAALSAYHSQDGLNWSHAADQALSGLTEKAAIGLAVSSGSSGTLNLVGVDQVDNPDFPAGEEGKIGIKTIKDNADASGVTFTGTWAEENVRKDRHGDNYRIAAPADGPATATFNPELKDAGLYTVYLSWPSDRAFAYDVPVTINRIGGSDSWLANQASGTNQWVYAGTCALDASSSVVIQNSTNPSISHTVADAVLFVPLPSQAKSP